MNIRNTGFLVVCFFYYKVVKHWNTLHREVADALSLKAFEFEPDRALSNVI